jgi:hypothetical protein
MVWPIHVVAKQGVTYVLGMHPARASSRAAEDVEEQHSRTQAADIDSPCFQIS